MTPIETWKSHARALKCETYALYLACRDPRTPWYAKAAAACVLAYAFSPIDLIPDPIPVLGHLDDLLIVPLGIALVWRMLPTDVLHDCREKAKDQANIRVRGRWAVALIVVVIWCGLLALAGVSIYRVMTS